MKIPTKTKLFRKDTVSSGSKNSMTDSSSNNSNASSKRTSSIISTQSSSSSGGVSLLREDLQAEEEFEVVKILGGGSFSKVILAKFIKDPVASDKVVVQARARDATSVEEFNREVELTYLLSPHPNVVMIYNLTFLWDGSLCFLQEYAGCGSLGRYLAKMRNAMGEEKVKSICTQIASALEFMHSLHLVHGQVTPNNILIFKSNLSLVKLSDFSETRTEGSVVVVKKTKANNNHAFTPPELSELVPGEQFEAATGSDVWQLGVLTVYLLSRNKGPWAAADETGDPVYRHYVAWLKRKSLKTPGFLKPFSPRFVRLFKRLCDPKPGHRSGVREVRKYLKDPWLVKKPSKCHGGSFTSRHVSFSSEVGSVEGISVSLDNLLLRKVDVDKSIVLKELLDSYSG